MMEKISVRLTKLLLKKNYIKESDRHIYQYGIQMMLETGFSFITSVIICCLWGKIIEGILFFAVFIPLRSFLGGFHLKSYGACYLFSCFTFILILGLSCMAPPAYVSWFILCLSQAEIIRGAHKEKLRNEEGKHFYPKICLIALFIVIAAVVLSVSGDLSKLFLIADTCLLAALSKLSEKISRC